MNVTIGIPTHNDYHGLYFTVHSLRMHHGLREAEFVIVDQQEPPRKPDDPLHHGRQAQRLAERIGAKYDNFLSRRGSGPAKNRVFELATGDIVFCVDTHVLFSLGAIAAAVEWLSQEDHKRDIVNGPCLNAWGESNASKPACQFAPIWSNGMFGKWATDPRYTGPESDPFPIGMTGCGAFAMRKQFWPRFHPEFTGFGGEEGYIHERVRQCGGKVMCLPKFEWLHRFDKAGAGGYRNAWVDRVRNYLLGWRHIGLELHEICAHFYDKLTADQWRPLLEEFGIDRDGRTGMPSLPKQGWNLAKAMTKWAAGGLKKIAEADYRARLELCELCPRRLKGQCSVCGCPIETKCSVPTESCPLTPPKWTAVPAQQEAA